MKKFIVVYGLIGILIIASLIYFRSSELPEINRELYKKAYQLSDSVTKEIWPGYMFKAYPVAICKGNSEFVFHGDEQYKRKAVLPVMAATAYKTNGEINIFMPSKLDMDSFGQIAEGLSESQEQFLITGFTLNQKGISDNRYIAILFHEGLHAYQIEYFEKNLFHMSMDDDHENEDVLTLVDTDAAIQNLYVRENEALYDILQLQEKGELKASAVSSSSSSSSPQLQDKGESKASALSSLSSSSFQMQDRGELKERISRYLNIREERLQTFLQKYGEKKANALKVLENYYEKVEGTARYTEAKIAKLLGDDDLYLEYIQNLQVNAEGKEKYYRSGMGICLVLDTLNTNWKEEVFSKPDTMHELLTVYWRALNEQ